MKVRSAFAVIFLCFILAAAANISAQGAHKWLNGKWIGIVGAQAEFDLKAADNRSVKGTAIADTSRGFRRGTVTGTIDGDKVILEVEWSTRGGTPRFELRKTKDGLEGIAVGRSGRAREAFFEKAK